MAVNKIPIDPTRIRRIPATGFGWIDRRFVRQGYIEDLPREAIVLYFFLVAVSDGQGLSFYADPTVAKILKLDQSDLLYARTHLIKADLIAYRYPLYQVLALPDSPKKTDIQSPVPPAARGDALAAIADVIDDVLASMASFVRDPNRRPGT
jgi:hypothetical protein